MSLVAVAAFALGTVGNVFKGVPQFARTAVRGRVAGLAPSGVWLAAVANVLWLCFAVAISAPRFLALSALGVVLTTGTLARFLAVTGVGAQLRRAALSLAACATFCALAAVGGQRVLAALGTALGVALSLPQLLHLWRRRRQDVDVSGVSGLEYAVVVAAQIGWTVYWLTQDQYLVAVGAAWGGLARLATLVLVLRHARPAVPAARDGRSGTGPVQPEPAPPAAAR